MKVAEILTPRQEARREFLRYRESVRERMRLELSPEEARLLKEDQELMEGYRVISRGARVLNINETMRAAGCDELGRPRLAIACAAATKVRFVQYTANGCCFTVRSGKWMRYSCPYDRPHKYNIRFPLSVIPGLERRTHTRDLEAVVPLIPLRLRPRGDLKRYAILWEADWEAVPTDPLLLRHLKGPLYAILAQWDLTPLEKAVMEGRLTS